MKHGRIWAATAAIVVLGGGSIGFLVWRSATQRADQRARLIATVDAELRSGSRDGLPALLRRVQEARKTDGDPALVLAEGRLLLGLGREQQAWDAVEIAVTSPGASPEARLLGARILERVAAMTGDRKACDQARGLAEQHVARDGVGGVAVPRLAARVSQRRRARIRIDPRRAPE